MVDAALKVVVLDCYISCFHFVFELAEAVGYRYPEEASVTGVAAVAPSQDVALGGASLVVLVFVKW